MSKDAEERFVRVDEDEVTVSRLPFPTTPPRRANPPVKSPKHNSKTETIEE